jgi:hypothetical protein
MHSLRLAILNGKALVMRSPAEIIITIRAEALDGRVSGPPPVPPLETPGRRREENINETEKKAVPSARRSVLISTAAVYAAMYAALAFLFNPISYGVINLRVANVLIGLIPIIGWPAVLGPR